MALRLEWAVAVVFAAAGAALEAGGEGLVGGEGDGALGMGV